MSRDKTWKGFDYALRREVERTRKEWRELIVAASRTVRADGDLLLLTGHRITAEVYDRE